MDALLARIESSEKITAKKSSNCSGRTIHDVQVTRTEKEVQGSGSFEQEEGIGVSHWCTEVYERLVVLVVGDCCRPGNFESSDVSSCSDPHSTSSSLHYHSALVFVLQSPPTFSPLCLPTPLSGGLLPTLWARGPSLLSNSDGTAPCTAWAISIGFVVIFEPNSKDHSNEQESGVVCLHPGTKDLGGESACSKTTGCIRKAGRLDSTRYSD